MIFLKMFSRKWLPITILIAIAAVVCGRLGIWQLDRLAERRIFNAHVHAVQAMLPLNLPAQVDLTTMEYRPARVSGTYDFTNQVAIRDQFYNNQLGYHLLTPLKLVNATAIFIDRGWIPSSGNLTPSDWRKYDQPGEVLLNGVIRLSQTTVSFGSVGDPTLTPGQTRLDFWVYVNLDRIGNQMPYPILPAYVQLDPVPNRTEPPIPYQPELDLSEGPHQSYAIQWFSFGTIFLVGYPLYLRRQENRKS